MEHAIAREGHGRESTGRGRAGLHVHTLYSDGGQSPEAIVRAAAGRLDVVGITDHEHPELGVDMVVGEEISTLNEHLIALFLSAPVPPGLSARGTIRRIHDQGGLAVAAHPFHPLRSVARGHRPIGPMIPELPLDAIEVVNNGGVFSRLYDAWAALRNVEWMLPVTAFTTFPGRDASAPRGALEAGRTRARVEWSWTAAKMPRHVHIQSRSAIRFLQGGHRGHS